MTALFDGRMLAITLAAVSVPTAYQVMAAPAESSVPAGTAVVEIDPKDLAQQINGEVMRIGPNGTIEDFEASILFMVSQQNYSTLAIRTAVEIVRADGALPKAARKAATNVLLQLARRRFQRGTGAFGSGDGGGGGFTAFSAPIINGGGVSDGGGGSGGDGGSGSDSGTGGTSGGSGGGATPAVDPGSGSSNYSG